MIILQCTPEQSCTTEVNGLRKIILLKAPLSITAGTNTFSYPPKNWDRGSLWLRGPVHKNVNPNWLGDIFLKDLTGENVFPIKATGNIGGCLSLLASVQHPRISLVISHPSIN